MVSRVPIWCSTIQSAPCNSCSRIDTKEMPQLPKKKDAQKEEPDTDGIVEIYIYLNWYCEQYDPVKYFEICHMFFNPYLTNGFSHHYQLDESTFIFRGVRSDFRILFRFSMIIQ